MNLSGYLEKAVKKSTNYENVFGRGCSAEVCKSRLVNTAAVPKRAAMHQRFASQSAVSDYGSPLNTKA